MLLMLFVQLVGCYIEYVVESHDAALRYAACLEATVGAPGRNECYFAYLMEAGDALIQYSGCFAS